MADRIEDYAVNSARWLSLEDFDGEIWKDVVGEEGKYKISNYCRVMSLPRKQTMKNGRIRQKKGLILRQFYSQYGYPIYSISQKVRLAHIEIAKAFIPNPDNKPQVDHINTIRTDCRICNLRWVSIKENCNNPITLKRNRLKGIKPIIQLDSNGRFIKEWTSIAEASRHFNVLVSTMSKAVRGIIKSCCGYQFVYKDKYTSDTPLLLRRKMNDGARNGGYTINDRSVCVIDNGIIEAFYVSPKHAAKDLGFAYTTITGNCNANRMKRPRTDIPILRKVFYYKDISKELKEEIDKRYLNKENDDCHKWHRKGWN